MDRFRAGLLVGAALACAGCTLFGDDAECAPGGPFGGPVCGDQAPPGETAGRPRYTPGSSLLVALPDTQAYSKDYPGIFDSQTAWIARHAEALDIRHVFHLGDIVDYQEDRQWGRARNAMSLLDGVVPYVLVPGNHDYGPWGSDPPRSTELNQWFAYDEAASVPTFGGAYQAGRLENTYHLFEAAGRAFIAIALEWGPRDEVVAWADQVMQAHPDRLGILVTHAYLDQDDRRYDHADTEHPQEFNPHDYPTPGSVNDGEQLWQKLVRRHRFVMTLSGHVLGDGAGYLASTTDRGTICHQMLSNYQFRELGGEGYLRLLELLPDGRTVHVSTYSPLYDRTLTGADQDFTLDLGPPDPVAAPAIPQREHRLVPLTRRGR